MNKEIRFEYLHPHQLEEILLTSSTVFVPLGVLEWHERHLPFGVDGLVSYEICRGACRVIGGCVLPTLYLGTDTVYEEGSKKYRGMNVQAKAILPGSIYPLDEDCFEEVVRSVVNNLKEQGFKRIVLVTGHCEPTQLRVLNRVYKEQTSGYKVELFPREGFFFAGGLDHAGEIETRLMLAIDEEQVDMSRLEKPYTALIGEDPKKATKKEGVEQLNSIVKQLVGLLQNPTAV